MNFDDILKFNEIGIIPAPEEEAETFSKRANYSLNIQKHIENHADFPFNLDPPERHLVDGAYKKAETLFGIAPLWVPVIFDNYKLTFWQGGAAWIFQLDEKAPLSALIQVRKNFEKNRNYLGLWNRDEILAHEFAHIGRLAYNEKKYEEIIASQSSSRPFSHYFGALFQSRSESVFFVTLLALLVFLQLSMIFSDAFYGALTWMMLAPLVYLGFLVFRLYLRQTNFRKTKETLHKLFPDPKQAQSLLYRLTDREIDLFSDMEPEAINRYFFELKDSYPRDLLLKHIAGHKAN